MPSLTCLSNLCSITRGTRAADARNSLESNNEFDFISFSLARTKLINITSTSLQVHSTGLASPILGLAASPDDAKVAVGMGNLVALLRR